MLKKMINECCIIAREGKGGGGGQFKSMMQGVYIIAREGREGVSLNL